MQTNSLDMSRFTVEKGASEWQDIIKQFEEKLNPARIAAGYKPMRPAMIAKHLSRAGVHDAKSAYRLYRQCQDFDSFSKGFWYLVRNA